MTTDSDSGNGYKHNSKSLQSGSSLRSDKDAADDYSCMDGAAAASASKAMKKSDEGQRERKPEPPMITRDDENSASLNLRNLSKVILPPLGVSSCNQPQPHARRRIITPMDSRYRFGSSMTSLPLALAYMGWDRAVINFLGV
ncbi:hypothetical protein ACLOJK_001090 [Asimina triloba]